MTRDNPRDVRRSGRLAALSMLASADVVVRQPRWAAGAVAAAAPGVLFEVRTDRHLVALTFDDGPDPHVTPALLEVLARHGATATFFVMGDRAARNPAILHRIAGGGHELGNHLMGPEPTVAQALAAFERDLLRCGRLLSGIGDVRHYRPASGWIRPRQLAVARRHGYRCVLGSVTLVRDPVRRPAAAAHLLAVRVRPGAILVLHEGTADRGRIVETVDRLLTSLSRRGYRARSVSSLLGAVATDAADGRCGSTIPPGTRSSCSSPSTADRGQHLA
ncbi:MAG TPA: polysaccharide deacetylase family protein [Euzebyales bacterium]|nr:polysaccharide deacetylase family protein [Euzebyales bacterium]